MSATRKPTRAKGLGVTDAEYAARLAAQGGGCAICGNPPKVRRLNVDHEHRSGAVRGLLCFVCNHYVLGKYATPDKLEAASIYLNVGAREDGVSWIEWVRTPGRA